jgi:hypothetical protein
MRRDAQLGHAGRHAAAKVVQRPGFELYSGCGARGVEQVLAVGPRNERLGIPEDEIARLRQPVSKESLRRDRQGDEMRLPVLGPARRQRDEILPSQTSSRRKPPISSRRWPVRISSLTIAP